MKTLKDAYCEAYLQLLQNFVPHQISVKQIVMAAYSSRSSFYTYFDSREQLHYYLKQEIEKQFLAHYDKKTLVLMVGIQPICYAII